MNDGFISRLFDFSFHTFVTTSIIKVLYILALVGAGIFTLLMFASIASQGAAAAVLALIITPIIGALAIIGARVYMEVLIVLFRIAENTEVIARASRNEPLPAPERAGPDSAADESPR